MTELLAPAGDEQSAYAALNAGADAVYLGLTRFSARESAENFSLSSSRMRILPKTMTLRKRVVYSSGTT